MYHWIANSDASVSSLSKALNQLPRLADQSHCTPSRLTNFLFFERPYASLFLLLSFALLSICLSSSLSFFLGAFFLYGPPFVERTVALFCKANRWTSMEAKFCDLRGVVFVLTSMHPAWHQNHSAKRNGYREMMHNKQSCI